MFKSSKTDINSVDKYQKNILKRKIPEIEESVWDNKHKSKEI